MYDPRERGQKVGYWTMSIDLGALSFTSGSDLALTKVWLRSAFWSIDWQLRGIGLRRLRRLAIRDNLRRCVRSYAALPRGDRIRPQSNRDGP